MGFVIKCNPMYYYVEYFRDVVYRCSVYEHAIEKATAAGQAVTEAMISAAQLPTFGQTFTIYAIGLAATLVGGIIFLCTKRKFIYNI